MEKAQRPEGFMGRSVYIERGGNKMKGLKELQSMNSIEPISCDKTQKGLQFERVSMKG